MTVTRTRFERTVRRSRAAGFTLIELLIVVVIIGLLAAIAVPKFSYTKQKAYISTMRGDLRNLATAQEAYWADFQAYYSGAIPSPIMLYTPSQNVSIVITEGTSNGWSAKSSHINTTTGCSLFAGTAAPQAPAVTEGLIACS
ncbi:MAG: type IV pilin protein [Gemmatimonadales bacterium]